MTITLHWWWIPVTLVVLGWIIGARFKSTGDYDFFTPFIGLAIFLGCLIAAVAFTIGKWVG